MMAGPFYEIIQHSVEDRIKTFLAIPITLQLLFFLTHLVFYSMDTLQWDERGAWGTEQFRKVKEVNESYV